jgi:AAA domain (dynein-related subfamily)
MARPRTGGECRHCKKTGLIWHRLKNQRFGFSGAYKRPWVHVLHEVGSSGVNRAGESFGAVHACPEYKQVADWFTGASSSCPRDILAKYPPRAPRGGGATFTSDGTTQAFNPPRVSDLGSGPSDPEPEESGIEPLEGEDDLGEVKTVNPKLAAEPVNQDAATLITQALQAIQKQAAETSAKVLDEGRVTAIAEEVSKRIAQAVVEASNIPRRVELTLIARTPKGEEVKLERAHKNMPVLFKQVAARRHCYIWGEAGSSKTTSAGQVSELCGLRHAVITMSQTTTKGDLFGFRDAQSKYVFPLLREYYENGGCLIFDEFDNSAGNVAALLNGLLGNGRGSFPDGMVTRHPDFVVVATGNTNLRGATRNHSSRTSLDLATVARFRFIEWPYDLELEAQLVQDIDKDNAPAILAWSRGVREYLRKERVEMTVCGPRESINIAKDLQLGFSFAEAAEGWVFRGLEQTAVAKITAANPFPKVRA